MIPVSLSANLVDRIQQHARDWRLSVEESFETESSIISFVMRDDQRLVLKIVKQEGDEWRSGEIVDAFDGRGVVRVYEHTDGAILLERLQPGTPLSNLALDGCDEQATKILAAVIAKMSPRQAPANCPTVDDLGQGFQRYLASGDQRIPRGLVESAQQIFSDLCGSQRRTRLLHGDLQHYNVLLDSKRGWLAIDPKGVVGEAEFEVGAMLRNPVERPELFLSSSIVERRLRQFEARLNLNRGRMLGWAFAQAVLSAIWDIEDGFAVDAMNSSLRLAELLRPMVGN